MQTQLSTGLFIHYQEYSFLFLLTFLPVVLLNLCFRLKTLEVLLQNKLLKSPESKLEETYDSSSGAHG